jgi:hypothetical protein
MNFWKTKFCPGVLVLIVLMLVCCGEKAEKPEGPIEMPKLTLGEHVRGAIGEIMSKMRWNSEDEIASKIRTRRSLAKYLLTEQAALMAHFMSMNWDELPQEMIPGQELYWFDAEGNSIKSTDVPNVFWKDRYADMEPASEDTLIEIELEGNGMEIWLEDEEDPMLGRDCTARIEYECRIVSKDEDGNVVNSRKVAIRSEYCHRYNCPWKPCEI